MICHFDSVAIVSQVEKSLDFIKISPTSTGMSRGRDDILILSAGIFLFIKLLLQLLYEF